MFGHEQFEAYQLAIKFLEISLFLADQLPVGNATIKDQLKRAATSVPLNIAEGTGKQHKADRRRFYMIARGSAMESAAICDVIMLVDPRLKSKAQESKVILKSIVGILTKVCFG